MKFLRQNLRSLTWLVLLVMGGLALAPTISRSLSVLRGAPVDARQTLQAMAHTAAAPEHDVHQAHRAPHEHAGHHEEARCGSPAEPPHQRHDHLDHCAMCGIAATAWMLAPAAVQPAVVALADASPLPKPALTAPHGLLPWAVAQPRGPPRSSLT